VFAYHEIVRAGRTPPPATTARRCDVYYRGELSPDFYGWVFPHGDTAERRHRQRRQGLLAAQRHQPSCATRGGPEHVADAAPRGRAASR
jgi:hypothetical protein